MGYVEWVSGAGRYQGCECRCCYLACQRAFFTSAGTFQDLDVLKQEESKRLLSYQLVHIGIVAPIQLCDPLLIIDLSHQVYHSFRLVSSRIGVPSNRVDLQHDTSSLKRPKNEGPRHNDGCSIPVEVPVAHALRLLVARLLGKLLVSLSPLVEGLASELTKLLEERGAFVCHCNEIDGDTLSRLWATF